LQSIPISSTKNLQTLSLWTRVIPRTEEQFAMYQEQGLSVEDLPGLTAEQRQAYAEYLEKHPQ
jgi:hypothetical protein